MCSITERCVLAVFAATEIDCFCLLCRKGLGLNTSSFMRAITEWLALTTTTGAPVVGLAFLDLGCVRGFLGNYSFITHYDYSLGFSMGLLLVD